MLLHRPLLIFEDPFLDIMTTNTYYIPHFTLQDTSVLSPSYSNLSVSAINHLKYCLNLESMNGNATELENMKQEILREMRKEIAKAKLEIIEGNLS